METNTEDLKKVEKPEVLGDILKQNWETRGGEENESRKQHILRP